MPQLSSGTTADLTFDPATMLLASHTKPLERVIRVLDTHLPHFFEAAEPLSGVEASSFHFVKGVMHDGGVEVPAYLNAKSHGENPPIAKADKVAIVSGICLFGGDSLKGYGPGGIPAVLARPGVSADEGSPIVVDVQRDKDMQIYIPESVARLSRTIIALLRLAQTHGKDTSVFMHLPGAEYKIMAEAAYAADGITPEALRQYYRIIDAEVADIQALFSTKFHQAGLPIPTFGSPLDNILARTKPGELQPKHFRNTPYEVIALDMRSQTMKDVGHVSEVVAYAGAVRRGNLPIFVDNHRQAKIFKIAKETSDFRGVAIYPLPMCVSKQTNNLMRHRGASKQQITRAIAPWQ